MKEFDYRYKPIYNKLSNLGKTAYDIFKSDLVIERNNKIIDNVLTLKNNGQNLFFKLKERRNVDRKFINFLKNKGISAIIN